ncbi:MAG: hypothetical protein GY875_25860 [Gammaproteobacteria bacterium]|nr:hypothetical protein [Gammaproteobacteria bacterium]
MNRVADPDLVVPRTCTKRDNQSGESESRPLAKFGDELAYVLLGDPGAGKTISFEQEAIATGGHYVRARSFAALDSKPDISGKTLFIDGLDEMRAGGGDGRTPLDLIRHHLDRLGRPRFRLSCREADWYGDSDRAALEEAAPAGSLTLLHLDPLSDTDILLLLDRKFAIDDPAGFVLQADRHGLADLLRNPHTLKLLANAVGGTTWPDSRAATYDLACRQLLREPNSEHRAAKRETSPKHDDLLDAAGFLCAVHLLADIAGFALDDDATDSQHLLWREFSPPRKLPLFATLASGLFQSDEREQQRIPVHRSIAEFLGARYLAELIDTRGLPLGRVIALLTGEDGGVVPDLRGLTAWLAVHCRSARMELVNRDPLGIVLYGDVRAFPSEEKRHVLAALKGEAEHYVHFRFEDWTAAPFGNLATRDMVPEFLKMLAEPSRAKSDIALLNCALDALLYGPPPTELATADDLLRLDALLDAVARDASYPSHIRKTSLKILLRELPRNASHLVSLSGDIHVAKVDDEDDQLLGQLLTELFPKFIPAEEVFDYLHPKKRDNLIGDYYRFWNRQLAQDAPDDQLPELLDQLAKRGSIVRKSLDHHQAERMAGYLLVRALETHADKIDNARLYDWLGTGLDEYGHIRVDGEHQKQVAAWLAPRAERYKSVLLEGAQRCVGKKELFYRFSNSVSRLYGAEPPSNIIPWYLERAAAETQAELKKHFFSQAVIQLVRQGGQEWLTLNALDYLSPWMAEHPEFELDLKPFTSLQIDDWRKEDAATTRKWENERKQSIKSRCNYYHENLDAIRDGSAHPHIFHELAEAYLGRYSDIEGETPSEHLADLLGGDEELITAAYSGFRRCLDRDDLPSVAEIVNLETEGRMFFIRQPCLVGMDELYCSNPEVALRLDDEVLRKLLAFRLTLVANDEAEWFTALVKTRPALVAEILIAYATPLLRKGHEHLHGIWSLAYDADYAIVAGMTLPDLLKGFPLRAKNKQLSNALDPLLKAALHYLDRQTLAAIVPARLSKSSMSESQRVYWLACGLISSPEKYEKALATHIGTSKTLRGHLGAFLKNDERHFGFYDDLPESSLALLVELLAPESQPERLMGAHWVSPAMEAAELVRHYIDVLGGNPRDAAQQQLERLSELPQLGPWHDRLQHASHTQRIARRKARFRQLSAVEICRTLSNRDPANAADLAALTWEHLHDLARKIRNGSTNDYRQYWSYDTAGKPERPKPENDCRDILLSDLTDRLGRLGIDAIKEGYYAEDKRSDIRVSAGGAQGFNVPIEVKKDKHRDLWRAIREQLIERYTRDPGTDGFGIYLVFWFGGEDMPLPQEGKKPRHAAELEQRLHSILTREEARHIAVVVIDCALP